MFGKKSSTAAHASKEGGPELDEVSYSNCSCSYYFCLDGRPINQCEMALEIMEIIMSFCLNLNKNEKTFINKFHNNKGCKAVVE